MMACTARFGMGFLFVVLVVCGSTSQTEVSVVRVRRQDCQDGTYEHDGKVCCMCGAGSRVEAHCTAQDQTRCEPCEEGTEYQSRANSETTCERCTSCEQLNANLEVETPCTPAADAKCKCKVDHYCPTEPCKICEPCQVCGPEGIKVACSATNNTICRDKPQGNTLGIILGICGGCIAGLVIVGIALYIWKKTRHGSNDIQSGGEGTPAESVPLKLERLEPHVPAVAEEIGWKSMRTLALKSQIPKVKIESCELDYPTDSTERTISLMNIWAEKESKGASQKLVQFLIDSQLNSKAEKVLKILSAENGPKNV